MTWGGVGWRQGKGDGQVGANEGETNVRVHSHWQGREGAQPLTMGGKGRDGYDDTWKGR